MLDALWLASGDWDLDLPDAVVAERPPLPQPTPGPHLQEGSSAIDDLAELGREAADETLSPALSEAADEDHSAEYGRTEALSSGDTAYSPVRPERGEATVAASPITLPAARTLADRLPLTRALRPLRQPFPSQCALELDEEATTELTAELRSAGLTGVFPVERPARERWFDVHVVLEDDPAAALWEAPLEEFARVLAQSGAFRSVRTWRLELDPVSPQDPTRAALAPLRRSAEDAPNRHDRRAQTRISGRSRELIFFASHGASAHWLDGSYAGLLLRWSNAAIALLHLLPGDRQAQTALGDPHGVCLAPQPGASAAALRAEVMWWRTDADPASQRAVRLPLATLEPAALGTWALAEMARGRRAPLYLLDADDIREVRGARPDALTVMEVEQRLASVRERSAAAYELAIALSAGPFTLPVARVVQEVVFGSATDTTLLADLLLSGVVAMDAHDGTGDASFRVVDHARAALAQASRGEDRARLVEELQARVGRRLGDKAAEALSFTALMRDAEGHEQLSTAIAPFASFLKPIVRSLAPAPEPLVNVERLVKNLSHSRIGELYRLTIRDEVLSERTVRADLWRSLRAERLVSFVDGIWTILPEFVLALRVAANEDPLFGLRILWVDDQPTNNRSVSAKLRARKASIEAAQSTDQAIARTDLEHFDVIVSDMSRPPDREAGFSLITALRARGFQTPVVIYASIFAQLPENRQRVLDAGGLGCTNDGSQLLEILREAAFVLLSTPALKAQRPSLSLDDVRKGLLAQFAARYGFSTAAKRTSGAIGLSAERARLVSLIRYRATTPPVTGEGQPSQERPRSSATAETRRGSARGQDQPPQQRQMQQAQAQGDAPTDRATPFHLLVGGDVADETRANVQRQLQLLFFATDAEMSAASQGSSLFNTGPSFAPSAWHDALVEVAKKIGWTVSTTFKSQGLIERDDGRARFQQMMLDTGSGRRPRASSAPPGTRPSDRHAATTASSIIDDWQQSDALVGAEVPSQLSSAADYAARGLNLRLAALLSGRQERGQIRLVLFSRFITKIQGRNVFLLRFSQRIESATLVLSMTTSVSSLADLSSTVSERLSNVRPGLLALFEIHDLAKSASRLPRHA